MNLAGPPLFIDDAYCRWMQDTLVDRPGQIRMRGPIAKWYTGSTFTAGQQAIGAAETVTPSGEWRGAVFATGSSTTDGVLPTSLGIVKVFDKSAGLVGTITLPFNLNTKWSSATNHWSTSTIIDAKPALGGGVWVGVTDEYGVLVDATNSKQALMLWRGAGKATYSEGTKTYTPGDKNITISTIGNIESGMFVFDTTADNDGNGRYLGVVSSINTSTSVATLEKKPLVVSTAVPEVAVTGRTLTFTSLRGFVHQHGRGVATTDGGAFITSGRLGSDAEGLFGAARVTIGASAGTHTVYAYRHSDHQFIGEIEHNGTVSNTQVAMTAATFSTVAANFLKDDNYFIIRNDTDLRLSGITNDTTKYSMLASQRIHDSQTTLISSALYTPIPGIFNSTYANRQWFASIGDTAVKSDKFVNRVVFSGTDNPENVNLSPDASDSIIVPGREAIRGIAGSVSGLLVFVESKTYIVRGTNRQNFSLEELYPDGCLCTSSIVQVGGGVIWAGKQGIYYYDGATVRNFTNQSLGVFYTDGVAAFNATTDRIYAFVYNNYLIINFTKWQQNYPLTRFQAVAQSGSGDNAIITLDNAGDYTRLVPTSLTFNIFLPTGAVGTLSNTTPRGFMSTSSSSDTKGLMVMNQRGQVVTTNASGNGTTATLTVASHPYSVGNVIIVDGVAPAGYNGSYTITAVTGTTISYLNATTGAQTTAGTISDYTGTPKSNNANILDLSTMFTEIIDTVTIDAITSNDSNRSSSDIVKAGPDFYLETKQYNFNETTLRKWWRKILFSLSINNGFMVTELVDINNNSLVDAVTFKSYAGSTANSVLLTLSGTRFPYTNTKAFSVVDATDLSTLDYLKLTHSKSVTNKEANGTSATLTVASHGLSVGDTIVVDLTNDTTLDGVKVITAVTTNTLSYASLVTVGSTAITGSVSISVYGYVVSKDTPNTNDIVFRLTEKTATGTHTSWTISRENTTNNTDESGYFLIPNTSLTWGYYDNLTLQWVDIEGSALTWAEYFGNKTIRYSKWIGVRQSSLGFRFYGLRDYIENNTETVPELVNLNDWVFGLKPLRKGRN